jgi:ABC-type transport system involved in multi-copper enzyme maturation permease subunit
MIRQTGAILLDAYRELQARKLFWVAVVISGLIVAAFAAVGVNERGITLLWWEFPSPYVNTRIVPAPLLYTFIFATVAIPFWLGWGAMILAIVSTAGMIPDFIAGGAVELVLSKPIGRLRLILTKFAAAMLFAALQVAVFSGACFLVIGLRGGIWEPRVFLAVPLIVLLFSYIYALCFLLGMVTRSTVASMLLTFLAWFGVFGLNTTEQIFLSVRINNELRQERLESMIAGLEGDRSKSAGEGADTSSIDAALTRRRGQLAETKSNGSAIRRGHQIALAIKTALPKTQETIKLLDRVLLSEQDRERFRPQQRGDGPPMPMFGDDVRIRPADVERRTEAALRSRTVYWVIGTSLAFEAAVVGLGAWVFCRRDF